MNPIAWNLSTLWAAACLAGWIAWLSAGSLSAAPPDAKALEQAYQPQIRPLLERYCHACHAGDRTEAELDLASFATWAAVRQHPQTWQKIGEMLDSGQMPPDEARQPNEAERTRLQQWVRDFLTLEAQARAGDPGRVVLRRLNNAEYTYTLRDLTGIETLNPAREFPVDGAAGEGFTNTGAALAMSPALVTKYLDAGKETAQHAVLLPDGFRFSPHTTRSDWTNESLEQIRTFYRQFTDPGGGERVNLQGVVFDTNGGGRLPLEKYLAATLEERAALSAGEKTVAAVAAERGLNAKYLATLWASLTQERPSLLLKDLQSRWRQAKPADAAALAGEITAWQDGLWKFNTVGHIGKVGGPKRWMEPVSPLTTQQEVRFKIPAAPEAEEVAISLVAGDAGDGNEQDYVVWRQPRLVAPGRPDLLLRDVRAVAANLTARRERLFANAAKHLAAAAEAAAANEPLDADELARKHGVPVEDLRGWLDYLGVGAAGPVELTGHWTEKITNAAGYDFVRGWGSHQTPLLLANSSDQHVRVPGNMKPHSVGVHPSPTLNAAVGWRSPVTGVLRISATVAHAHPECGNGVTWFLELRRGATRQRLAAGRAQGAQVGQIGPLENVAVRAGDVVALSIGPGEGNHACDMTAVDLELSDPASGQTWNLANDVSGDVLAGNPHADRFGNPQVWHFYAEPASPGATGPVIPGGSLLAKWMTAPTTEEKQKLAEAVQKLLTAGPPAEKDSPDAALYRQLGSLGGPLVGMAATAALPAEKPEGEWGLDPALFGKHPQGGQLDAASLCVHAPAVLEIRLPADLVAGCELVTTGVLDATAGAEGSVQLQVIAGQPAAQPAGLAPSRVNVTVAGGQWTDDNRRVSFAAPILVQEGSAARKRLETAFDEFRNLFPAALCYTKIVPVDEVVTLTLFFREDDHLVRLMLDPEQQKHLDRLWDELHYISHDALTLVDAYAQLMEYATQDADPSVFEPLRQPIHDRAAAFRQRLVDTEPEHVEALVEFAAQAYRRPLTAAEADDLRAFYQKLRTEELPHEDAFRLTLTRVFVSPAFLYRLEQPVEGAGQGPVSDWELASRLSYFLWSSQADEELRAAAAAGQLQNPDVLLAQTRRMLRDAKTRRLAVEFACQWLHIHDFENLDEKSERHFPTFTALRGPMYEESIRFFTDLFQSNRSVFEILDADYTFLNQQLAEHYGIPGVSGPEWRRVDGVKRYSRGGILAQATTLAKHSGASRSSPILRGTWVSEVLLGERLPRPPKGVPPLPDEGAVENLTVRQIVERHVSDAKCALCHRRIDPFGFSLEAFDAIGRYRELDANQPIDARVKTYDGVEFEGLDGLRNYLLVTRREAFLRQFCRKLLGYALGRSVQLSDEPLLAEMQAELKAHDYQVVSAVETIIRSRQFREIRGRDVAYEE